MSLTEEQQRDIDMMRDPDRWPQWPVLPVKRTDLTKDPAREVGIIGDGGGPTIHLRNLFASSTQIKDAKRMEYLDFTELVQDGWGVD